MLGPEWRSKAGVPVVNLAGYPVDAATMLKTMGWILQDMPLDLDRYHRPFTLRPCLSYPSHKKCGTAEKVGYSCYGCIGAKFPTDKSLFRYVEHADNAEPCEPNSRPTQLPYGRRIYGGAA